MGIAQFIATMPWYGWIVLTVLGVIVLVFGFILALIVLAVAIVFSVIAGMFVGAGLDNIRREGKLTTWRYLRWMGAWLLVGILLALACWALGLWPYWSIVFLFWCMAMSWVLELDDNIPDRGYEYYVAAGHG